MIIKPSHRLGKVRTYYFATKLAQIAAMNQQGMDVLNLGIGSPDMKPPQEIISALQKTAEEKTANKYQSYKGIPELRHAFSSWYKRWFDVSLNAQKEVLPLIGSKEGIMHISMSFLEQGDEVLVPNPGYPAYRMAASLAGATVKNYDLISHKNWKPDLEILAKDDLSKVKIMWLNYPNMPTGAKADLPFFKNLISFAKQHKILLCHDNPYGFILNDQPNSILEVEGAKEVAIELNSLSKCFNMAGWRVGVMVGAEEYINTVMKFKSNMDSGMYMPIQKAAAKALLLDQKWFDQLNETYKERRKIVWKMMDLLQCEYDQESAGLFVWGRVPGHIMQTENWVEDILQQSKVFITPGFIFGTNGENYIRISLCNDVEILEEALRRLEKFVNTYQFNHSSQNVTT